ncbi:hypothetical protein JYT60_00605 [bacterium AH-315-C08]|nr:hypothetical protein [bacterium AH-315-C08]
MDIPTLPLANFVNKIIKILSGEDSPLIPLALKNQLQTGKLLQGEIIKLLPNGKATVSIAGQKVVAELPRLKTQNDSVAVKPEYSFKPGQKIYVRVEKVNPEPVLKLVPPPQQKVQEEGYTTNLSRKIKPEILKFEKFSELKLPPDRIVQVNVNRAVDANTLSVQFEDQEFLVKTENAKLYRPDTAIRIQFQKTDSGPVFLDSPVKPGTVDLELIKPYLPFRTPLGKLVGELTRDVLDSPVLKELKIPPQLLEKLRETLQVLTPKPGVTPDEVEIEEQVEKSGVRYEAKVKQFLTQTENPKIRLELARDLKGQLLDLLQVTEKSIKNLSEQNQSRQISDFQQRVKVSVDSIELNQLSSRVATQENQPLVLQIPNPLSPGEKTINLFIREDSEGGRDGKKDDKEAYNMAFFLNLSALGNIKINAKVGPESLAIRMEVEQDDVADFIRNNSAEFEQRMEKKDMNTTVECFTREEVKPIKDNLIELLVSQNTSLLSVKT